MSKVFSFIYIASSLMTSMRSSHISTGSSYSYSADGRLKHAATDANFTHDERSVNQKHPHIMKGKHCFEGINSSVWRKQFISVATFYVLQGQQSKGPEVCL